MNPFFSFDVFFLFHNGLGTFVNYGNYQPKCNLILGILL